MLYSVIRQNEKGRGGGIRVWIESEKKKYLEGKRRGRAAVGAAVGTAVGKLEFAHA